MELLDVLPVYGGKKKLEETILLSFDIEEFDVPREHGVDISLEDSMKVSIEGTNRILDVLKENFVRGTFFCTGKFAEHAPKVMKRIMDEGHEVACHGVDHFQPKESDVALSKQIVERVTGRPAFGYRQPRMFPVSDESIEQAGYLYNSSLHPAFIPGRYMHLSEPRTPFYRGRFLEIPASVTPWFRLPVFWLACHHYPMWLYKKLCLWTLHHDGQFVIYFHPWEFIDLNEHSEWKIPWVIRHHSGKVMTSRLRELIQTFKAKHATFGTFNEFVSVYEESYNTPSRV